MGAGGLQCQTCDKIYPEGIQGDGNPQTCDIKSIQRQARGTAAPKLDVKSIQMGSRGDCSPQTCDIKSIQRGAIGTAAPNLLHKIYPEGSQWDCSPQTCDIKFIQRQTRGTVAHKHVTKRIQTQAKHVTLFIRTLSAK